MAELAIVAVLVVAASSAWWLGRDLRAVPSGIGSGRGSSVSVVVPARDEEATLPTLLASLRGLTGPVVDVVVVDDDSHDATAAITEAARATVLPAGTPPAGWTGKAWACHVGAHSTSGEMLLFLDADTVLAPDALDALLDLHHRHGGLVSAQPFHAVVRPYEHLSAYFNVVSLLATGAFSPRPSRRAMAFGPCLLTSRADYERAGGHGAVRGEILDDVQLAAAYQRCGIPVRCWVGGRSIVMRSYPGGIRQLADGWTKNIASGASATAAGPALLAVLWVSAHHAVAAGVGLAAVEAATGWGGWLTYGDPALWALAWLGVAVQLRTLLRRVGSFGWWTWALFPVPLLAFDVVFARSAAQTALRRSVQWRGREVDLSRRTSAGGGI